MFGSILNSIDDFVTRKVEDIGMSAVMGFMSSTPLGAGLNAARRVSAFIDTSGTSELDRIGSSLLRGIIPSPLPSGAVLDKLQGYLSDGGRKYQWQRAGWALSREDWITNRWRHDWRSQPRHPAGGPQRWSGTWMHGRLSVPVAKATAIGKGKAKTSRRLRRAQRYRRYGKRAVRGVVSSWSNNGD